MASKKVRAARAELAAIYAALSDLLNRLRVAQQGERTAIATEQLSALLDAVWGALEGGHASDVETERLARRGLTLLAGGARSPQLERSLEDLGRRVSAVERQRRRAILTLATVLSTRPKRG